MVVKRKVSLGGGEGPKGAPAAGPSQDIVDLFFNTGVVFHEVKLGGELPDVISSFVVMKTPGPSAPGQVAGVRRASPGEEADVEISALEHLAELSGRWLPIPYQLSCLFTVQVFLGGVDPRAPRVLLAIDTLETTGAAGRHLDAALDEGRPFRPLDRAELAVFLDHPQTRDLLRKLERTGVDRAPFKLAAILETLGPMLPRIRFSKVEEHATIGVSLVVDLGNSRSTAALVEDREKGLFSIPLEVRSSLDPLSVSEDTFDSRVTFLPPPFDEAASTVCVGDSFVMPSIVRMGREALDRALETPHRYACTLSGPKRYLWDGRPSGDKWHFAAKQDGDYKPIFGRILKHIQEDAGGLGLRADGPSAPSDPRYPPRTMMLFAMVEIVSLAIAQINSPRYRAFQGKEASPRVLRNLVLTYPSGMQAEERRVYDALVANAVRLVGHLLHLPDHHRPNWIPAPDGAVQRSGEGAPGTFEPFLFVDEALAAQMVYVYQEIAESFAGSMEELVRIYGRSKTKLRIGSIDIGGGTSDVMIAEYEDKLPGSGTALAVTKLFQDGVSIAGDEVCRAILEDVVFAQILAQLPSPDGRAKIVHLFGDGDGGHGAAWRTLKAKLVPYFWLPLARAYWSVAEGHLIPGHAADKVYSVPDLMRLFPAGSWSETVVAEADRLLGGVAADFPGLMNLLFRFDRDEIERTALGVLREPLRKYADLLAQFDVDLIVLAGKTSALPCVYDLFVAELAVAPPRIRRMSSYKVGDWYPSKWREAGFIRDPKSTVTAGATVLHMAAKNRLPGFLLDRVDAVPTRPIFGLYQETEPHIPRQNELFRDAGKKGGRSQSPPFAYTRGMTIGFRNVDSPEMDASPLFEVLPRTREVEQALLEDRVTLSFALGEGDRISIADVASQRGVFTFGPDDFVLSLRTLTEGRYWLDTGVFRDILKYI